MHYVLRRMSQASTEAAAIAPGSFKGTSLKGRCSIRGADLAPSVVEAAASERPMGDQVEQLAEAGITDKAEATERLRHRLAKEQPKIQTLRGPRTSRCCRQSDSLGRAARSEVEERCSRSS